MTITEHLTEWKARGAKHGLRFVDDEGCPRTLVGLEHLEESCWCISRAKDHAATWTEADGTRVVLWEPYDLDPPELARLHLSAAREGVAVFVSGHSPWNPGATLAVTFTQKRMTANALPPTETPFAGWLATQADRDDPVGDIARDVAKYGSADNLRTYLEALARIEYADMMLDDVEGRSVRLARAALHEAAEAAPYWVDHGRAALEAFGRAEDEWQASTERAVPQ